MMPPSGSSELQCILRILNADILSDIIELLYEVQLLVPFSETCKMIRQACKPCLFRKARISTSRDLFTGVLFSFTTNIWLYVRHLTVRGYWLRIWYEGPLDLGDLPLADFLARMPHLQTIVVDEANSMGGPGIPWDGLAALLSPPQLREFDLRITPNRGTPKPPDITFTIAPLTKLSFSIWDYRDHPRARIGETSLMKYAINAAAPSLEHLSIPLDVSPLAEMAVSCWPRLQVLELKGDRGTEPFLAIIDVLSRMPHLRHLTILRAQRDDSPAHVLWSNACTKRFPCPQLETMCLSHLDPADELFSHLPPTLRQLSLRCWPRHYLHQHRHDRRAMTRLEWQSQIRTASEVYFALRRCSNVALESLEIEYEEDDHESVLLRNISEMFPHLRVLTIYRYRRPDSPSVKADDIAQALSQLRTLRILRLHADLAEAPHPLADFMLGSPPLIFPEHEEALRDFVHVLAKGLSSEIRFISVLLRERWTNLWLPFRITRNLEGSISEISRDTDLVSVGGYSLYDDPSPKTVEQMPLPDELDLFEF
ncbi:hypothetical protein ONZ51_g1164 [Trametes cubensis]|uniref:F-box domain-containing protein n=1 Tax=Trametes cubensis TaxID=1111947 RepID=A0AAD7XFT7_9APHY|nr:hypothetical protein ONZ51_g1164 [Trametes cubensis]